MAIRIEWSLCQTTKVNTFIQCTVLDWYEINICIESLENS